MLMSRFRQLRNSFLNGRPPDRRKGRACPNPPPREGEEDAGLASRPAFLSLDPEETAASVDHNIRPILVPKDVRKLPLGAGYAETINGGKSKFNEDQAVAIHCQVQSLGNSHNYNIHWYNDIPPVSSGSFQKLEFTYFSIFDGHAGSGAAIMAACNLHLHIMEKIANIQSLLHTKLQSNDNCSSVTVDSLIVGTLETSFLAMDKQIEHESYSCKHTGGCTALVAMVFMNKIYVAQAGDSRVILLRNGEIIPLCQEFTPETEMQRLLYLAQLQPELMANEFSPYIFERRLTRSDIGKQILCRNGNMKGWCQKTIMLEDLRPPLITGEGKKARFMGTIGVTRGFGDNDLCVFDTNIHIKPFLSPLPEVTVYDISKEEFTDTESVLIMGSDGFWDVTSNSTAAECVKTGLSKFNGNSEYKYTALAQDLVLYARGVNSSKGWKMASSEMASYDDITVFVIPLGALTQKQHSAMSASDDTKIQ